MRLLIDAGNTLVKWQVRSSEGVVASGRGPLDWQGLFDTAVGFGPSIRRVAVSAVTSESSRANLFEAVRGVTFAPVAFYWSESARNGLSCAYVDPSRMGADRWHALYGGWSDGRGSFAVVDAGSAVTIDYVAEDGRHIGGYILPGKDMMARSLRNDAARIGFGHASDASLKPGTSTDECVFNGRSWLWRGMLDRLALDCQAQSIQRLLVTGGDALELLALGFAGEHRPDLVLEGLSAVDMEHSG